MKLYLCWTCVNHRRRPDGHDRGFRIEHALINNRLVLLHPHIQRNVIVLRPTTKRRQPQQGLLEAFLLQFFQPTFHEVRVSSVSWVARLERIDNIGASGLKLVVHLFGGQAPPVQTVVVAKVANNGIGQYTPTHNRALTHE